MIRKIYPISQFGLIASIGATCVYAEPETLAPVIVSASKIEQTSAEAPSNVSVVTSKQIEDSGAFRIGDALTASVPGLYIRGGALGTTSKDSASPIVSLRGAYGARTKVLLDGISSLGDANSGVANFSAIPLGDIDRVEVVPGVSSSLYGSDAIGGVINLITKTPTKREFHAAYTQGYGDGARTKYEAAYRDRFESGLGISIGFEQQNMDGFAGSDLITLTTKNCGTCTTTVQGWEKTKTTTGATQYIVGDKGPVASVTKNFSATAYYDLTPSDKFKLGYQRYETTVEGSSLPNIYLYSASGPIVLPVTNLRLDGGRVATLNPGQGLLVSTQRQEDRYLVGYEGVFSGDYRLKLDWVRTDREYSYQTPSTGLTTTYYGGPGASTQLPSSTQDYQAQLSFPLGLRHFVILGLARSESSLNRAGYSLSNWREDNSRTATTDLVNAGTTTNSIFAQEQFAVTDLTTLYLGGRYDRWSTSGDIFKAGAVTPNVQVPEYQFSAFSPRVALVHKLTDAISLKSSMGKAFRAPTMADLYAADTVSGTKLLQSNYSLRPETAKAWDIGADVNLINGAQVRIAYFQTRISDLIYSKESPYTGPYTGIITHTVTTLSQKTNAAEALSKGVEFAATVPLQSWLKGNLSYTYTDARITSDGTGTGIDGKRLVFVPKNLVAIGLDAHYQNWTANWISRYTGLQFGNAKNDDVEKDVYLGTSKYWLSNLRVSYRFDKRFTATAMLNNVFDKKYYENYVMPGRNWGFQLSADF